MPYSTYTDVGKLLNMTFTSTSNPSNDTVASFITDADAFIDSFCGHDWLLHENEVEYHDGIGYGPRAGLIILRRHPVVSISKVEYWDGQQWRNDTVQGKPNEYPTMQTYEFYPERGEIRFYKLRLNGMNVYRVTYTWGYTSVPTYVKDLSATLAALAVIAYLSGPQLQSYRVGDLWAEYPKDGPYGLQWKMLQERAQRLMFQLSTRRPLASVG
jgi:hypothetical protein